MKTKGSPWHHGDLRETLLREAISVIRADGVEALSIRALSRRIGVSEAAPYHHFCDRADLLRAVVIHAFAMLAREIERGEAAIGPDPVRSAAEFAASYVRFAVSEPGCFRAAFGRHVADLDVAAEPGASGAVALRRRFLLGCEALAARSADGVSGARLFASVWAIGHGVAWLHLEQEFADCVTTDAEAVLLARENALRLLASHGLVPGGPP